MNVLLCVSTAVILWDEILTWKRVGTKLGRILLWEKWPVLFRNCFLHFFGDVWCMGHAVGSSLFIIALARNTIFAGQQFAGRNR